MPNKTKEIEYTLTFDAHITLICKGNELPFPTAEAMTKMFKDNGFDDIEIENFKVFIGEA